MIGKKEAYCSKPLLFYESSLFDRRAVVHGMFTRHGGASKAPYATLNVGTMVGDDAATVFHNRMQIRMALGFTWLATLGQVHGDEILVLREEPNLFDYQGYDAIITDRPNTGLMIQQADCQAVLLHDPVRRVVAAIHSGWRGSVINIIGKTIRRMEDAFQSTPEHLTAVISPSLGPCCSEFKNYVRELPEDFQRFRVNENHFNFWEISREQLEQAGLQPEKIEVAGVCTMCDSDFFSYRRSRKKGRAATGRCCSVIALWDT